MILKCDEQCNIAMLWRRQMQDGVKSEMLRVPDDSSSEEEGGGQSRLDYSQYYPTLLPFVPPHQESLDQGPAVAGQPEASAAAADEVCIRSRDRQNCGELMVLI